MPSRNYPNPYLAEVLPTDRSPMGHALKNYGGICATYMEGFEEALRGPIPKDPAARVKASRLLITAMATGAQAKRAVEHLSTKNPFLSGFGAFEADGNRLAAMTDFVTKMVHWSLDPYWRMLSPNFVSMQPIDRPSGYVFFAKDVSKEDGRILSDRTAHDNTFSARGNFSSPSEGTQVKKVGITLAKELVECKYEALMWENSWEVETALQSQFALNLEAIGASLTNGELARIIDRQIMDALYDYAGTNPRGYAFFDDTAGGNYSTYTPDQQKAYDQTLISKTMTEVSIDMVTDISVQPSFYVCGPNFAKILARTPEVVADMINSKDFDQAVSRGSIIQTGRMKFGGTIWLDPLLDTDSCIAGYVDSMDPFYAGYICGMFGAAGILTPAWWDPDTLLHKQARGVAWYKTGIRNTQYRIIKIGSSS